MRHILLTAFLFAFLCSCSEQSSNETKDSSLQAPKLVEIPEVQSMGTLFEFDKNNAQTACSNPSQLVCAIEDTIKCAINPKQSFCQKGKMPDFVFMEDENIIRPQTFSYKITKIKALDKDSAEVFTEGKCDGNWFGLCRGNIIYVLKLQKDTWVVKELYAIEPPLIDSQEQQLAKK